MSEDLRELDEAHARDMAEKAHLDELRASIAAFVADPPARAHSNTLGALTMAVGCLGRDSARVVQAWN